MKPFYVYLLRCADGSYYCGHTDDLDGRLDQHARGAIGYTATRKPVALVWQSECETREEALAFERQIKGWSRAKKEALIAGDWQRSSELAKAGSREILNKSVRAEPVEAPDAPALGFDKPVLSEVEGLSPNGWVFNQDFLRMSGSTGSPRLSEDSPENALRQACPELSRRAQGERGGAMAEEGSNRPSTSSGRTGGEVGPELQALATNLRAGQRRALAKAITLVESTRADHQQRARALLQALLPDTGKAIRIGISGVPGVGKSTFIEALGMHLIGKGHRVAVLAVDPSSTVSGGSILGDKTRMERLCQREEAFIRPSPSAGALGGVADKTREAMLLCEAAGYDVIIVETVGVGQSETAVAGMTDIFVLLQLPNAGDDLQAIKKGIVELADLVVFNKADIDPRAADSAAAQMKSALALLHPLSAHWQPPVLLASAARNEGVEEFWQTVLRHRDILNAHGELEAKRRHQALAWMWQLVDSGLRQAFRTHPMVSGQLADFVQAVEVGTTTPAAAAQQLLALFSGQGG